MFCVLCLSYWVSLGKSKAKDYAYEIDKDDRYIQNKFHERLAWGMKKSEMENQQRKKTKSKNREMER